jgi:hypothetical protein
MLLLKEGVALLKIGELAKLDGELTIELDLGRSTAQGPLAHLLAPTREHEGVNVQSVGDLLDLNTGELA